MANVIVEEWTVVGMTCGGCAASVERVLASVPGVRSVSADFAGDRVRLEFDPDTLERASIRSQIEAAGFDVRDDD